MLLPQHNTPQRPDNQALWPADNEQQQRRLPINSFPSTLGTGTHLINTTPWWGGGAWPGEEDRERDPKRLQAMAWAVLMRRASLHACAWHQEETMRVRAFVCVFVKRY